MRRLLLTLLVAALPASAIADSLSTSGNPSPASLLDLDSTFVTGVGDVTDFRWLPDGRMVIVNKSGNVLVRPAGGGTLIQAGSFLVDTNSEKGLLGVAVDPSFGTNRRLYFYYSASALNPDPGTDADRHRVVVRTLAANNTLDAGETVLLRRLRGPLNHDGGALDIGPDGLLYIGVGDTGCNSAAAPGGAISNYYGTCIADDPTNNGGGNGKILRIGLDGSIPPSNPLVGATNVSECGGSCSGSAPDPNRLANPRPELFAWGFRNPFRIWVDPTTGKLWVGDVGEVTYEEITIVQPGRHHGWPFREGGRGYPVTRCHDVRVGTGPGNVAIQDQDCVDPVYYCQHGSTPDPGIDGGCTSINGGLILDDCSWPAPIRGQYVFGDNGNGSLWTLTPTPARDGVTGARADFGTTSGGVPVSIRTGNDGALYIAVYTTGAGHIARISPKVPATCPTTTTTTTLPGATTSTSTTVTTTTSSTSTTSTTIAGPCGGLAGSDLATCQLTPLRTDPLCGADVLPQGITTTVHGRAEQTVTLLAKAAVAPARRARRLLGKADHTLGPILTRIARAVRHLQVSTGCQATIGAEVVAVRQTIAALRGL